MTVWKFHVPITDTAAIAMPVGAAILHIAEQHGEICLWARVDPKAALEARLFRVVGTGHPLENAGQYLGSAQIRNGAFVFHVFEVQS